MSLTHSKLSPPQIVELNGSERWQIYRRLQELQIPCQCATYQPLQIEIHSSNAAIQLWSAIRQIVAPRRELVDCLERCWRSSASI
ncbi:MAG: hypothetical protein SW833_07665 [Cyanobacteriota bacterium]|nr:hypothetical protein [Cyanobacteriota bacterium]